MATYLDYPAQLALWRTVPLKVTAPDGSTVEPRRYRKDWYVGNSVIRLFRPGIKLTEQGKKCNYERKKHNLVAVGPALAIMLDRPELADLLGGESLQQLKENWEYKQNQKALQAMKSANETRLGYQYEMLAVQFDSTYDTWYFRIRAGQRGRGLAAIEKVLSPDEFADIFKITFNQDDCETFSDLAADPHHWE